MWCDGSCPISERLRVLLVCVWQSAVVLAVWTATLGRICTAAHCRNAESAGESVITLGREPRKYEWCSSVEEKVVEALQYGADPGVWSDGKHDDAPGLQYRADRARRLGQSFVLQNSGPHLLRSSVTITSPNSVITGCHFVCDTHTALIR